MKRLAGVALPVILAAIGGGSGGCSASVDNEPMPAAGRTSSAGSAGDGAGGSDGCASDVPSAAALMSTPREDTNIELLALKFSERVVAEQDVYDRLVRDLSAIRAQDPSVASINYFAPNDGKSLLLRVDVPTGAAIADGSYHSWDCLNDAYGASSINQLSIGGTGFVALTLRGIYRIDLVSKQYATLRGIESAGPAVGGGDGPTICLTRTNDVWHYVFDDASGDCLAGCTEHLYKHFSTDQAGAVVDLGQPSPDELIQFATRDACH